MRFGIVGAAAYIAPRHLKAIADTGNRVVAALDPHDNVGILDRFGYDIDFFLEPERFERHILRTPIDWLSVCSPNYLHDAHVRMGMRAGADVICEKPLALSPWNLDMMAEVERATGKRVFTVLQLRLNPALIALKQRLDASPTPRRVVIVYCTPRGNWYARSWKGDSERSGGIIPNIGIHMLDLALWLFGPLESVASVALSDTRVAGKLILTRAEVDWRLSIDPTDAPDGKARRMLIIEGANGEPSEEIRLDESFVDLHTRIYEETLAGRGFGIEDARPAVELAHQLRMGA